MESSGIQIKRERTLIRKITKGAILISPQRPQPSEKKENNEQCTESIQNTHFIMIENK